MIRLEIIKVCTVIN